MSRIGRKVLGLTQTELALASRLTRAQISAVETGRHSPNVNAALAIAEALGTPGRCPGPMNP